VQTVTSARRPLREDVDHRTERYLISMGIRTACVILAVVATGALRWVFLAGAVLLPYLAVVLANAGRERASIPDTFMDPTAITAGPPTPLPHGEESAPTAEPTEGIDDHA
jgi:hypothetical protein